MAVGEGTGQARGDLGAIDRAARDAEIAVNGGQVEAREMEELGHIRVCQQRLEPRRVVGDGRVRRELHEMAVPLAGRNLHQAQPVAQRVESHGLAVHGDEIPEIKAVGQVAMMEMVGQLGVSWKVKRKRKWCPGEDSNFHGLSPTST